MTVTPAYGRDYKSKREIVEDLAAGKDFIETQTGRYIGIEELRGLGLKEVVVRYGKLRKTTLVKLPKAEG